MKLRLIAAALASALLSSSALAFDREPCGKDMVCASSPQTIVDALQKAGYKAALTKSDTTGNPVVESAANGYNFYIYFYECEEKKQCGSMQFSVSFEPEDANTPQLANLWNKEMRFLQMSAADDKSLNVSYDVTTIGGLNQKNFAEVLDWWSSMLGALNKFFQDNPGKPSKK